MLSKVWLWFFGSTIAFIGVTTAIIKIDSRINPLVTSNKKRIQSIGETINRQVEYVIGIIASQGNKRGGIFHYSLKKNPSHQENGIQARHMRAEPLSESLWGYGFFQWSSLFMLTRAFLLHCSPFPT